MCCFKSLLKELTNNPSFPSIINSGIKSLLNAITGVPQTMPSTTHRPKGSSKLIRYKSAKRHSDRFLRFHRLPHPTGKDNIVDILSAITTAVSILILYFDA